MRALLSVTMLSNSSLLAVGTLGWKNSSKFLISFYVVLYFIERVIREGFSEGINLFSLLCFFCL